jgi:hypothetical protein
VSVLLVLSVAPFLFLIPSASTQALSTTTSTFVGYSDTFSVQGAAGYPDKTCYYKYVSIGPEWNGYKIFGSISATNSISFGILSSAQYYQYANGPGWRGAVCKFTAQSLFSPGTRLSQYSFNWTVPDSGDTYYFVFFNPNDVDVQVTFELWTISVSTITSTSTRQSSLLQSSARLTSSTQVSLTQGNQPAQLAQPSAFQNLPPAVLLVVAVIIIGIVIVSALVLSGRRAGKPPAAKDTGVVRPEVTEMPRQAEEGTQFCINCGAKLPPKSKFCNRCGTAQT